MNQIELLRKFFNKWASRTKYEMNSEEEYKADLYEKECEREYALEYRNELNEYYDYNHNNNYEDDDDEKLYGEFDDWELSRFYL